jgi:hypothetical protein
LSVERWEKKLEERERIGASINKIRCHVFGTLYRVSPLLHKEELLVKFVEFYISDRSLKRICHGYCIRAYTG